MVPASPVPRSEMDVRRAQFIRSRVLPSVRELMDTYPWINSMCLLVAQYWNDDAIDEVHYALVVSQLDRPDLEAFFRCEDARTDLGWVDPNEAVKVQDRVNLGDYALVWWVGLDIVGRWPSTGEAIPLFAAYCCEGASQEDDIRTAYRPYAVFRRPPAPGTDPLVEVVGVQLRPWLDGISPAWSED